MLILSRNPGESILIGRRIEVSVTKVTLPHRVYLGITAPQRWGIARNEIVTDISNVDDGEERLREVLRGVGEELEKARYEFVATPIRERPADMLGYVMRCVTDAQDIIRKELAE